MHFTNQPPQTVNSLSAEAVQLNSRTKNSKLKQQLMEKPHAKVAQKVLKAANSQSPVSSAGTMGSSRSTSPKENTKLQDFRLHTQQRAAKRAIFNRFVATKIYFDEEKKRIEKKIQKMIEEEEVRSLRKEMVPKAKLMPYFDKPFSPQRSNRPLTVPKEPTVGSRGWRCISRGFQSFQAMKTIK